LVTGGGQTGLAVERGEDVIYPVLSRRNFALLWLGGLASSGGDWLVALALPFYMYERTGSASATAAVFVTNMLPRVLFGSLAGVFTDRWDRRRTMLLADLARATLLLLLLPAAFSDAWLWLSYPVVALEATISMLFLPAKGSLLPHLVPEDELLSANSLDAAGESVLRLLAPLAGGLLFELWGFSSLLLIDSASYLCSALTVLLLQIPATHTAGVAQSDALPTGSSGPASRWLEFWRQWLAGLSRVHRDALLLMVFLVAGIDGIARGMTGPLLNAFIQDVLHAGADLLGWMVSATGVGTLATGLILGKVGQARQLARLIVLQELLLGVALFLTFSSRNFWIVVALQVPVGVGFASAIGFRTLLQLGTSSQYRGRVLGAFGTIVALAMLVGNGLGSLLAAPFGIVPALYAAGGLSALAGLLGLALLPSIGVTEGAGAESEPVTTGG
jgi:MFS family permease